jgi:hypothetical protein
MWWPVLPWDTEESHWIWLHELNKPLFFINCAAYDNQLQQQRMLLGFAQSEPEGHVLFTLDPSLLASVLLISSMQPSDWGPSITENHLERWVLVVQDHLLWGTEQGMVTLAVTYYCVVGCPQRNIYRFTGCGSQEARTYSAGWFGSGAFMRLLSRGQVGLYSSQDPMVCAICFQAHLCGCGPASGPPWLPVGGLPPHHVSRSMGPLQHGCLLTPEWGERERDDR